MGVHSDVYICLRGDAPLAAESRARIVELCVEHELLFGQCAFAVPDREAVEAATRTSFWSRVKRLFGAGEKSAPLSPFVKAALAAYGGMRDGMPGVRCIEESDAGSWIAKRAREHGVAFAVSASLPKWKGETQDGGFSYLAYDAPFSIHVSNAYRSPGSRNPHVPADGYVGDFFDVAVLSSRAAPDGRALASSAFVQALKKSLGVKVTCRASFS